MKVGQDMIVLKKKEETEMEEKEREKLPQALVLRRNGKNFLPL